MEEFNRDDLLEIIYKKDNKLIYKICRIKELKLTMKLLSSFTSNIRLDYHGIADLFDSTEKFIDTDKYNICIISYMGTHSEKRIMTRQEIMKRIESDQINFGIINFVRCQDKQYANTFHEPGSKAWINSLIKTGNNAIFIDDSNDHYNSTVSMKITNLYSFLCKEDKQKVQSLINKKVSELLN